MHGYVIDQKSFFLLVLFYFLYFSRKLWTYEHVTKFQANQITKCQFLINLLYSFQCSALTSIRRYFALECFKNNLFEVR